MTQQVAALPEVQAVYDAFDADPGAGKMAPHLRRLLGRALEGAGVVMGHYDERIAEWLSGLGAQTVVVIAGWVQRARAAASLAPDELRLILGALFVAADRERHVAAACGECEMRPEGLCPACDARLDRAQAYDALRGKLGGAS